VHHRVEAALLTSAAVPIAVTGIFWWNGEPGADGTHRA